LAGVKFLLKKERVFFFRGSALDYSGSAWGFNVDEVLAKLFFGEEMICFAPTDFLKTAEIWTRLKLYVMVS